MITKIRYKAQTMLLGGLVKLSLLLNSPFLTALAFSMFAGRLGPSRKPVVLCLGRSIFVDDIRAMAAHSGAFRYRVVHLAYFQIIFDWFNTGPDKDKVTEYNYWSHDYAKEAKEAYRRYLDRLVPWLVRLMSIRAVITGNILYVVEQELSRVCEDRRIPFIVLHKEAMVVPDAYQTFLDTYKDRRFYGALVMFYNAQCMEGFARLAIPGLPKEKMRLVGIPRFDHYFKDAPAVLPKKTLTFFTFVPKLSLRFLSPSQKELELVEQRTAELYDAIFGFAERHPELSVVIKTKMADHFFDYAKDKLSRSSAPLQNVTITNTADPTELIQRSFAVLAFNSTVQIEAAIRDIPVLSPDFSDIVDRQWSFFYDTPRMVRYIRTAEDLEAVLATPPIAPKEEKERFLREFIGTADGTASIRAETAIQETIAAYESKGTISP